MSDPSSQLHGPGGLLGTPGLGARRKGRRWGQRLKAKQIVGNLYRGDDGKFQAGGASTPAGAVPKRGVQLSRQPKPTARKPVKTAAPKKGGGGKGKTPKTTPEQRQQQRTAEQATNREQVLRAMNIAPDGQQALEQLRQGAQPDPSALARGGFEQAGLVERANDGAYRLTASGRAMLSAAAAGDAGRAGSIISAARDRTTARTERIARQQARAAKRKTPATATKAETYGGIKRSKLDDSVFAGPDRSFPIKTAQDVHDAVRSLGRTKHDKAAVKRGIIRRAKAIGATDALPESWRGKSFTVFKDTTGQHRWIARTTTSYKDRDGEIISTEALDQDSQRMMASRQFGPLRWWHVGEPDPFNASAPWGPGLDIGDCDYSVVIGRTRVESGTFRNPAIAEKMARVASRLEMSPGFFHPLDQPGSDGVFTNIRTFERSPVPIRYGRASNLFTGFTVKEHRMDAQEMERRFKAMITELQLTPETAETLAAGLVATEKAAAQQGIAFKSADVAPEEITINGVVYTVKAAPPPPPADDGAVEVETQAATDAPPDVMEPDGDEAMAGEYIGDMSWDEFAAKLSQLLAPVLKMQDMVKAMGDMHGELKSMYATKDAGAHAELIALKAQQQQLAAKIAQIESDQPSVVLPDDVAAALKSQGPATPPKPDDPEVIEAVNDPSRPFAGIAARTMPQLYRNSPDGGFAGWTPPQPQS